MSKKLKLILGIVAAIVVVLSGTLYGLAKTGVISLGIFADELDTSITLTVKTPDNKPLQLPVSISVSGLSNQAITGADGKYVFHSLAATTEYTIGTSVPPAAKDCNVKKTVRTGAPGSNTSVDLIYNSDCDQNTDTATEKLSWTLKGIITSIDGKPVSGATIVVMGKSAQSSETGAYAISDIIIPHSVINDVIDLPAIQNNAFISVSKQGYIVPDAIHLTSIFNLKTTEDVNTFINTSPHTYNYALTPKTESPATTIDENTFSLVGTIKNPSPSDQLARVSRVTVQCLQGDQSDAKCGDGVTKWQGESTEVSSSFAEYPDIKFNYEVKGINRYNGQTFPKLRVDIVEKTGFYSYFITNRVDKKVSDPSTSGRDKYVLFWQDENLQQTSRSLVIAGSIRDKNGFIGGVKIEMPQLDCDYAICTSKSVVSSGSKISDNSIPDLGMNFVFANGTFLNSPSVDNIPLKISRDGYFIDTNSDGKMDTGEDSVTIKLRRQDFNTFNDTQYAFVSLSPQFVKNESADSSITVIGSIKNYKGEYIEGKISLENKYSMGDKSVYNHDIESVPGANYQIVIRDFSEENGQIGIYFTPSGQTQRFKIGWVNTIKTYYVGEKRYFRQDYVYYPATSEKNVSFYDQNGEPLDFESPLDSTIIGVEENTMICADRLMNELSEESCPVTISKVDGNTIRYTFSNIPSHVRYVLLKFRSDKGDYNGELMSPYGDEEVYLFAGGTWGDQYKCVEPSILGPGYDKIRFCYHNGVFDDEAIANLRLYYYFYKVLNSYKSSPIQGKILVYITQPGSLSGPSYDDLEAIRDYYKGDKIILLLYSDLINPSQGIERLAKNYLANELDSLTDAPKKALSVVRNEQQSLSTSTIPPVTNFIDTLPNFFVYWMLHADQIEILLKDDNKEFSDEGKNGLRFLYSFFADKYKGVQNFKAKVDVNKSESGDKSTSVLDDTTGYLKAMDVAGYTPVNRLIMSAIANATNLASLSEEQISAGVWLTDNYQSLSAQDKTLLQLKIISAKAKTLLSSAMPSARITIALANLNTQAEKLLRRLGFNIASNSISGTVRDQDGPVSGFAVKFSEKTAITDRNGSFSISRTKLGIWPLQVSDPKSNKVYETNRKTLAISQNEILTNIILSIERKSYTLSGQVMQGDSPLANGKIILSDGDTIKLNPQGKFSGKFKEGQYIFTIKNKNGKNMKVTNPGGYANLPKVNASKDIDSLIWVK